MGMTAVRTWLGEHRLQVAVGLVLVVGGIWVVRAVVAPLRIPTRVAVLGRQLDGLDRFLTNHAEGFPEPDHDGLVVRLAPSVIAGALSGVLPYEASFGGGLTLRFDRVEVALEPGLPLVRIQGRAGLEGGDVGADVAVVLTLDVRSDGRRLVTRPDVLGFDLAPLRAQGGPVRIVDALQGVAEEVFRAVGERVSGAEIPVLLPGTVELPAVTEPEITIPSTHLPIAVALHDVVPLNDALWVALSVGVGDAALPGTPDGDEAHDPCLAGRRLGVDWCAERGEADTLRLADLVAVRIDSVAALAEGVFATADADSVDVAVRMGMPLLGRLLSESSARYLDSVALHVTSGIDIEEEGDVRASLGPIPIPIGSWRLHLTIERLEATLHGGALEVDAMPGDRLGLRIPVRVSEATGRVRIRFTWDAAAVTGLLCSDFTLDETYDGIAPPSTKELTGYVGFAIGPRGMVADPIQTGKLVVRPIAEEAAWDRVRQELQSRDRTLECGLGMDAEELEGRLRERMRRGFDFELPGSVLQPLVLPAFVEAGTEVGSARYRLEARPRSVRLTRDALEYGFSLRVEGRN